MLRATVLGVCLATINNTISPEATAYDLGGGGA